MAEADFTPVAVAPRDFPVYRPTDAQLRKWDRSDRARNSYHVTYWMVVEDRVMSNGQRWNGIPLSPKLATKQECRRMYAEIKGKKPRAYRVRCTAFLYWDDPHDIATRKTFLREMRHGAA